MKFVWSLNHYSVAYDDAYDSKRGEIASFGVAKLNLWHIFKTSSPNEFHKSLWTSDASSQVGFALFKHKILHLAHKFRVQR